MTGLEESSLIIFYDSLKIPHHISSVMVSMLDSTAVDGKFGSHQRQ